MLRNRTRYVTVVLEDIYQPHNASAVLRSCDCFGVHDVHIIENQNKYEINPDVALGSSKWLNLVKYNETPSNTEEAFQTLKNKGYTIVAASPHEKGYMLDELPVEIKPAFAFGTEMRGLSETAIHMADTFMKIPMYGFTESFNISVSAAIILHHFTEKLRRSNIDWRMKEEEMTDIKLMWLRNSIKRSDLIEKEFLKNS
jgi:tRNA (guanosine-2'-O-)-methyltransferase